MYSDYKLWLHRKYFICTPAVVDHFCFYHKYSGGTGPSQRSYNLRIAGKKVIDLGKSSTAIWLKKIVMT